MSIVEPSDEEPEREILAHHLKGLKHSFAGQHARLVVDHDEIPVLTAGDVDTGLYECHPWQFDGTHTGSFLGIEPKTGAPVVEVSFNGVSIHLPDGRWMTFIDSGHVMAQLGVTPGRTAAPQPVPPPPPES